jgi:hypothetical protein
VTKRRVPPRPFNFADARRMLLALPGVEEKLSYGTPGFRVGGTLIARIKEDGGTLVVGADFDEREALMRVDPAAFFFTDHYRDNDWVLVRLEKVDPKLLAPVLENAWRRRAPSRLLASKDAVGVDRKRAARRNPARKKARRKE